ncbi:hypothetical protein Pcinc_037613 [Petrolisthes cinctipes]|uniref:Uncharacterized protein n=1 Tax=Petrolisthes cinctipes TaxID=88211 RepID=A0AAE1EL64_PETCI|nr:hypothetical protein Pcinc_037613 [Petrolisthes cinctipes]
MVTPGLGITMGAHRLWAHRSFKAKFPLRFVLAVFQTMAFQNHIYEWARDQSRSPQAQRDGRRPTQRTPWLLLLPHGLADVQEAP